MAEKSGKRQKHTCPKLPQGFVPFQAPHHEVGMTPEQGAKLWRAFAGKVSRVRPTPRKTSKESYEI